MKKCLQQLKHPLTMLKGKENRAFWYAFAMGIAYSNYKANKISENEYITLISLIGQVYTGALK